MRYCHKGGKYIMSLIAQVISGLLVLVVIYPVVRSAVYSPRLHMFAKQQYEKFVHYVYDDENKESKI